jgi:hypothetical protein
MDPVFSGSGAVHPHRKTPRTSRQIAIFWSMVRTCLLDTSLHELFGNILSAQAFFRKNLSMNSSFASHENILLKFIFSGSLYQTRVPDSDSGKPDGIKNEV